MSEPGSERAREVAVQREVAKIALASVDRLCLGQVGCDREHGMIKRPTENVDLFTTSQDVTAFGVAPPRGLAPFLMQRQRLLT